MRYASPAPSSRLRWIAHLPAGAKRVLISAPGENADLTVVYGVNRGWDLIVNQLNYERVSLAPAGMFSRAYEGVLDYARTTKLPDGRRVVDQEWVRVNLAKVKAHLDVLTLLNWNGAPSGGANPADASATKVFGTEFFVAGYKLLMEVLGTASALERGSPGAALAGRLARDVDVRDRARDRGRRVRQLDRLLRARGAAQRALEGGLAPPAARPCAGGPQAPARQAARGSRARVLRRLHPVGAGRPPRRAIGHH